MSNTRSKYLVLQLDYTTAEVEDNMFCGEIPNAVYFAAPQPPTEVAPVVLIIVNGKPHIVRSESPPGARLPNYDSVLFKLAEASVSLT